MAAMTYALLPADCLVFGTDSSFGPAKREKMLSSVKAHGFKYPISVSYDGIFKVTWGRSRAWAAKQLGIPVPAVVFDNKGDAPGEPIEDPRTLFDCKTMYKPHKDLIAPRDKFWT